MKELANNECEHDIFIRSVMASYDSEKIAIYGECKKCKDNFESFISRDLIKWVNKNI